MSSLRVAVRATRPGRARRQVLPIRLRDLRPGLPALGRRPEDVFQEVFARASPRRRRECQSLARPVSPPALHRSPARLSPRAAHLDEELELAGSEETQRSSKRRSRSTRRLPRSPTLPGNSRPFSPATRATRRSGTPSTCPPAPSPAGSPDAWRPSATAVRGKK